MPFCLVISSPPAFREKGTGPTEFGSDSNPWVRSACASMDEELPYADSKYTEFAGNLDGTTRWRGWVWRGANETSNEQCPSWKVFTARVRQKTGLREEYDPENPSAGVFGLQQVLLVGRWLRSWAVHPILRDVVHRQWRRGRACTDLVPDAHFPAGFYSGEKRD